MSCPHSMIGSPEFCSQCLGAVPSSVRRLDTLPEGEVDWGHGWRLPLNTDEQHQREVSRHGAQASAARRARVAPSTSTTTLRPQCQPRPRPEGTPDDWMTSKEVVARFGVARRALDRARTRGIVLAVASHEGGAKPTYWYDPASVAAWVAKWRTPTEPTPSEPTAPAPEATS